MSESATCHNCEGAGGATAKTGDNRKALSRGVGMSATCDAMESKTRSGHPATDVNNKWQEVACTYGDDNIKT